ncbi:hypothetical protein R3P38DRAFT_1277701 [Favolaschia claudopus]|uniref:Uncharacterized protein n=1 Tax=Favolaschia claudopus TaxID=2862362 RepID=A0AAW0AZS2_9AGAR
MQRRKVPCSRTTTIWLLLWAVPTTANCLSEFLNLRQAGGEVEGGTNNKGQPVNIANATAMTYDLCIRTCGSGPHINPWSVFSQRFSTWLLPFLALVSQLPFGANNRVDNLMTILLNVGSPTLATYSLMLTLLNTRWVKLRFSKITYPNSDTVAHILSKLQQVPLQISEDGGLLASLIVLPENDVWWCDLLVSLGINFAYTWSFANVASICWVAIAFLLTIIDTFTDSISINLSSPSNFIGLTVAFAWLWLIPLVITWLQFGSGCDRVTLHRALKQANRNACVATENGAPVLASTKSSQRAISIAPYIGSLTSDEHRTPPVYNYARLFRWSAAVDTVYAAFTVASQRAALHLPVEGTVWETGDHEFEIKADNRRGSMESVSNYIFAENDQLKLNPNLGNIISSSLISRMISASIGALFLTWGTVGGAIVVAWFTPTIGLSCVSGSYLIYAINSTVAWILLVVSNLLSALWITPSNPAHNINTSQHPRSCSQRLSTTVVLFRWTGKLLAALNAIWLVLHCIFHFSGIYDTCWCDTAILHFGSTRSYAVWILTPADVMAFRYPGVGGTVLACGTVLLFLILTNILLDPLKPVS